MSPVVIVVIAVAVVLVLVAVVARRRSNDGVESFRRQIDALGPEARRGVVDQVNQAVDPDAESDDLHGRRRRVVRRNRGDDDADESGPQGGDDGP